MSRPVSDELFDQAKQVLVGGVNSPVRAFKSVGGSPVFIKEAHGPIITSEDEMSYIDYVLSYGPLILGHSHPLVTEALNNQILKGTSYGAPTKLETELAYLIQSFFPSIEKVRFVNSGTEAVMSAIRLARGVTGRDIIVKFNGCYHGHVDSLLVSAGSGNLTLGVPDSQGVLTEIADKTVVINYNDIDAIEQLFNKMGDSIAAVIVEPICGNMGVVPPLPGFLESLQSNCKQYDSLLIFDEVMTGFRVSPGGAQSLYGIKPDLTILGKVIGGGLPCGAYGGSKKLMAYVSPEGPVYQAGTLSGNPLAMVAGITTLNKLKDKSVYSHINDMSLMLVNGLKDILEKKSIPYCIHHFGSMFSLFFTGKQVTNLADVKLVDTTLFNRFFHLLLDNGVYIAPSAFEASFVSFAHQKEHVQQTLNAVDKSLV
ncbi:glutamate-1-semialdehyde-2,1-aminomutase [Candidatus Marinamargulisbacteria bacterium SCGC AG-410-N11]|nr:glutamate-1-semialdehyde-2,1-aminomutase [Candidatus Marinamargulisbacteria bacterium SCGC AG-410-N11]